MRLAMLIMLAAMALLGVAVLLMRRLRYAITERHLKVTLFGLCLRRIRLADIESISKRPSPWAEKWPTTLRPSHRTLVIRRRSGLFKVFVITPRNRYVFRNELERRMSGLKSQSVVSGQ
jgi:hypothetical protein